MKKITSFLLLLLLCGKMFGQGSVTTDPGSLNADQQAKITFKATSSSPLYNYTGDVYAHIGVVDNGTWLFVPAAWGENIEKCKMVKTADRTWTLTLSPTIRQWFGCDNNQSITKLGLVFRSADGTLKGLPNDYFLTVTDEGLYISMDMLPVSGMCPKGSNVSFSVSVTQTADLTLQINGQTVASQQNARSLSFNKTFDAEGSYSVVATASNSAKTVRAESNLVVFGEILSQTMPSGLEHGINRIDDNTVTFVLYDKDLNGNCKDYAFLIGDFNDWKYGNDSRMYRDNAAGCWWKTVSGLDANTEYAFQYLVGASTESPIHLADAYCEKILDPDDIYIPESVYPGLRAYPSDKTSDIVSVFKIKETPYDWEIPSYTIRNPEKMVIYELHLRDFTETGDINGAIAKLDYIKSLGVNAVELMPIQEFDGNDSWGYNPRFFFAMDKAYGTKADYKRFVDECHKRNLAVILDVVYNHATGSHPFAKLYWNPTLGKTAASNPWFNVNPPHPYDFFHDFNHESSLVRQHVKRNLAFLLEEYNFDGFRFDFTKGFTQTVSNDNTQSQRDDARIAILKDYHAAIKAVRPQAVMILEHLCDEKEESILAQDGMYLWRNMNHAYCQAIMGFPSGSSFDGMFANGSGMPKGSLVGYMESHDEERMMYKADEWGAVGIKGDKSVQLDRAGLCAAFSMLIPGPKMIWQFGELGYDYSIDYNGRVGRKPVRWDYLEDSDRNDLYQEYSYLLAVRESYPHLFDTSVDASLTLSTSNFGSARKISLRNGSDQLFLLGNFSVDAISAVSGFPSTGTWYELPSNTPVEITNVTQPFSVPAHGYRLFSRQKLDTGIAENDQTSRFSVYPNPTVSHVYFTDGMVAQEVSVFNMGGSLCGRFFQVDHVDLSALPAGCYLLKVRYDDESFVIRVLKN